MRKYHCYILDDEPLALAVIEQHLAKFEQFEVCGKSTDPLIAIGELKGQDVDLLFLDIEMPELNGLDLLESITIQPQIIITTAYRDYAVRGFDLNVLDYLVKPIPFKRFVKAIDRFLALQVESSYPNRQKDRQTGHIFVRANRKQIKIPLDEILYVEGLKDYVKIVLLDQNILSKASIGNFLQQLPSAQFIRVHKSYVVAKQRITAYTSHDVEIGEKEIPIGRMYKDAFLAAIM